MAVGSQIWLSHALCISWGQLGEGSVWGDQRWLSHALCLCLQVVLDCPSDSCFNYIYQYEPYLRDPVAYPKVQVSVEPTGSSCSPCRFLEAAGQRVGEWRNQYPHCPGREFRPREIQGEAL